MPPSPQGTSESELQDLDGTSPTPCKRMCISQESKENAELGKASEEMFCSVNLAEHPAEEPPMPENNLKMTQQNKPKIIHIKNVTNYLKTGSNNRKLFL